MTDIPILILAAGSSSRLGQSKQLLMMNDQSLLLRAVLLGCEVSKNVMVVLGSNFDAHQKEICAQPVHIANNHGWSLGMGHSLKFGLMQVQNTWPGSTFVLVMVCDQPRLSATHLRALLDKLHSSANPIVCSAYKNILGVPAVFRRDFFNQLMKIGDSEGAKRIIEKHPDLVTTVDFAGGEIDIDTPSDLQFLSSF